MEGAAKFLKRIGPEELERCLFPETLALVAAGGRGGGHLWVGARPAPYKQEGQRVRSCLLVRAECRGALDGVPFCSTLKGYVTMRLETLEQEQHQSLEFAAHPIERRTRMVQQPHGVAVTVLTREGKAEPHSRDFSYGWASLGGLLGEAASLLLLRVLARRRAVPPGLIFPAIDSEGHLGTVTYRALGAQRQPGGSAEVEVVVLERAVRTKEGVPAVWHSSFLPSGRLARQLQVGCPVLAVLQDEDVLSERAQAEPQPAFPKQPLEWEEDAQLRSWFLDRKEELQASHSTYTRRHPELAALLADFLQALLLRQPPDPVLFAARFFAPFARRHPPGPPFASSRSPPQD
ncbi:ciliogenesis-associated TTC17-interacting protein [Aythya fuligula]|uniref:Ciliogenesis-associated TTC17-interacting protein n=1 Tax=Aythya fuligula TaxID=219594 RepID=A0A6J3D3L5_AYTFU|nr:ciliogenesis-associated TTC17-interacting protein [Aythya fuligula]